MSHLDGRIAEYVFEEMPEQELASARQHLAHCSECREQVEAFQHTHVMLKTVPDVDPPRRIVFEAEKRRIAVWASRWLEPAAAAIAASVITAVLMTPGAAVPPSPQSVERAVPDEPEARPLAQP